MKLYIGRKISKGLAAACLLGILMTMPAVCSLADSEVYTVEVESGYLALRNAKAFDAANEIGRLYSGETVTVIDNSDPEYWTVSSPKLNITGYVNSAYLVEGTQTPDGLTYTVCVSEGYLALRSEKAYAQENEIGRLYTGDTVSVLDDTDNEYWYVYSVELNRQGFVNKDYLISSASPQTTQMTVITTKAYVPLRSAAADNADNEIGRLYSGDQVLVTTTGESEYLYVYVPSLSLYGYVESSSVE